MEEIYEKIKDFESKEEGKLSLFETIKDYEEKGLFTKPDLLEKDAQAVNLVLRAVSRKEKEIDKLIEDRPLKAENLRKAILKYKEVKELIKRMPSSHTKEKSKAYESALSWYYTIKKLKEDLAKKKETKVKEVKIQVPVEKQLAEVRKLKQKIVDSHTKIVEYLQKKDLEKSIKEYANLKQLCENFPQEMETEKTALLADALSLYESIKKLRHELVKDKGKEVVEKHEEQVEKQENTAVKKEILKKLKQIKELLAEKDAVDSIMLYKELKELFKQFPEDQIEEKKKLYEEILATHKDIKLLEESLKKEKPSLKNNILEINNILGQTHELLDKGDPHQSTQNLLEAKHKIQMLPKEAFDEKYKLLKEVEKLEHKLLFVKNIKNVDAHNVITNK